MPDYYFDLDEEEYGSLINDGDYYTFRPKCECGADKCKLPIHSEWCPKYEKPLTIGINE
jgi:hypothetical protein